LGAESEDLEDRSEDGNAAIAGRHITDLDVVGITAGEQRLCSWRSEAARQRGATTIFIACVPIAQVRC